MSIVLRGGLRRLTRLLPLPLASLLRTLYHCLFRLQLRFRCWLSDRSAKNQADPLPPALLRYRVSESVPAEDFFRIGTHCANLVKQNLSARGVDLARMARVLDFGCGCGRTLKWLIADCREVAFYGVDVDKEAIEWCGKNLAGNFSANSPEPPLSFPENHFDAVYCFSVFTHLNEAMQDQWLSELNRVLKPGGALLITVHGQNAAETLDSGGAAALNAAGFLHQTSPKLKGLVPEWYHTTWHSSEYIVSRLSRSFVDVRYEIISDGLQDIVTARASQ